MVWERNHFAFDRPNHHPLGESASNGAAEVERTKGFLEMRSYSGVLGNKKIALSAGERGEDTFQSDSINESTCAATEMALPTWGQKLQPCVLYFAGALLAAYVALGMVLFGVIAEKARHTLRNHRPNTSMLSILVLLKLQYAKTIASIFHSKYAWTWNLKIHRYRTFSYCKPYSNILCVSLRTISRYYAKSIFLT